MKTTTCFAFSVVLFVLLLTTIPQERAWAEGAAPPDAVVVAGNVQWGVPFEWPAQGALAGIRAHMKIHDAYETPVRLMLHIHEDLDGRPGTARVLLWGEVRDHAGSWVTFPAPEPLEFVPGEPLWLVIDSPSGDEVAWLTGDTVAPLFRKDLMNGRVTLEPGRLPAFEVQDVSDSSNLVTGSWNTQP